VHKATGYVSVVLWMNTSSPDAPCWELTTLWVARLDYSTELKVTDPKEQQGDIEKEEAEGKERRD